jgi:hypothetical protein
MYDNINDDNYIRYAEDHYHNPQCVCYEDFLDDLNRIKYVKRLLNKYDKTGDFKERLILNHVIIFYNVVDHYSATRIWFTKIDQTQWSTLKTILEFLGYMPRVIHGINSANILSDDIPINEEVHKILVGL